MCIVNYLAPGKSTQLNVSQPRMNNKWGEWMLKLRTMNAALMNFLKYNRKTIHRIWQTRPPPPPYLSVFSRFWYSDRCSSGVRPILESGSHFDLPPSELISILLPPYNLSAVTIMSLSNTAHSILEHQCQTTNITNTTEHPIYRACPPFFSTPASCRDMS